MISLPAIARASALAIAACATLLSGCAKGPPVVLSYAEVVAACTAGAIALPAFDAKGAPTNVLAPVTAAVEEASLQPSSYGRPAISFELAASDAAAFGAWTAAHDRKPMALILDGRVAMVATVHGRLPGSGLIEFPAEGGPTREEMWRIVEGLTRR